MREVYIGRGSSFETAVWEQIDVDQNNNVTYMFASPIFEDLSKIKSNRTNTYKIPATAHNLRVFELVNQPDVKSHTAHRNLYFMEYLDGLPIIPNGMCSVLDADRDSISLSVAWGNKINFQKLSEVKLNELPGEELCTKVYYPTLSLPKINYLLANDDSKAGILYMNFGMPDMSSVYYVQPSVRLDFIMEKLEKVLDVKFEYDHDILIEYWIPLLAKLESIWAYQDAKGYFRFKVHKITKYIDSESEIENYDVSSNEMVKFAPNHQGLRHWYLKTSNTPTFMSIDYTIRIHQSSLRDYKKITVSLLSLDSEEYYEDMKFEILLYDEMLKPDKAGFFTFKGSQKAVLEGLSEKPYFKVWGIDYLDGSDRNIDIKMTVNYEIGGLAKEEVKIIEGLPQITGTDFLKSIMHLFGLYAYYDVRRPNIVKLLNINDLYGNISKAKDWTQKRISSSRNVERKFKDFAQKNWLRYATDDTLKEIDFDPNGSINIDQETLSPEKDILTLKFAPSEMNKKNSTNKEMVFIPFYYKTNNGAVGTNKLAPRMVKEGEIEISSDKYKLGVFDKEMYFSWENNGLLEKYYKTYQWIIDNPVVLEEEFYLSPMDIHIFSEIDVIHVEGNYWMPITLNVDSSGKAKAKLLLLPNVHNN